MSIVPRIFSVCVSSRRLNFFCCSCIALLHYLVGCEFLTQALRLSDSLGAKRAPITSTTTNVTPTTSYHVFVISSTGPKCERRTQLALDTWVKDTASIRVTLWGHNVASSALPELVLRASESTLRSHCWVQHDANNFPYKPGVNRTHGI